MSGTPLTDAINALTTYSNTVTGASDTTLSEAVATLASGYGGGGGNLLYSWDFTQSLTDTVNGSVATLYNCTQDSTGVHFTAGNSNITFDRAFTGVDVTYEIDIVTMDRQGTAHGRVFMLSDTEGLVYRSTGAWGTYKGSGWSMSSVTDANYFSGSTLKVVYDIHGLPSFYKNNSFVKSSTGTPWSGLYTLGSSSTSFYNMTISALRIYKGDTTQ